MSNKGDESDHLAELFEAVLLLKNKDECLSFFEDLCTPGELRALADRWLVARMLREEIPYRTIYEKTGVSTATVTRVARALAHGANGYNIILDRTRKEKK
jgi:TrpR-related protein YerC/YecD